MSLGTWELSFLAVSDCIFILFFRCYCWRNVNEGEVYVSYSIRMEGKERGERGERERETEREREEREREREHAIINCW